MANTTPHSESAYDQGVRQTIPFFDCFHSETLDLVSTARPQCKNWLDTGCGTGVLAALAAERFPETDFYLCDPSEGMLEEARKKAARFPRCRVMPPCHSQDLRGIPGLPELDIVTAIQSHHYLQAEGRRLAVKACYEILRSGGLFITFENIRPLTETGTQIGLERWVEFQRRQGKSEREAAEHRQRFGQNYFPISVPEHLELLKETGFSTVELFWHSHMQAGFYALK